MSIIGRIGPVKLRIVGGGTPPGKDFRSIISSCVKQGDFTDIIRPGHFDASVRVREIAIWQWREKSMRQFQLRIDPDQDGANVVFKVTIFRAVYDAERKNCLRSQPLARARTGIFGIPIAGLGKYMTLDKLFKLPTEDAIFLAARRINKSEFDNAVQAFLNTPKK